MRIAVIGAGAFAYWNIELRWRPKTITRHQAEIAQILEQSGWVSPGLPGPRLYMVSFRTCPDCVRFKAEEFPKLHKAGVDTRVIMIARPDKNGVERSTAAERVLRATLADVAEEIRDQGIRPPAIIVIGPVAAFETLSRL